jgi:hypothetical protein
MTASGLWQDIGAGENLLHQSSSPPFSCLRRGLFFLPRAVLPLTWPQQAVLGSAHPADGLALARSSDSYLITLTS